jgi:hypothetical protein
MVVELQKISIESESTRWIHSIHSTGMCLAVSFPEIDGQTAQQEATARTKQLETTRAMTIGNK